MNTPPRRKKLIEVALPLEAINKASAREKSIRHGHPSTLHLWWARRPLAACRAVLFASLVDDPDSDPAFNSYKAEDREHAVGERRAVLFDLIEELVQWKNSNNMAVINRARAEIASSVVSRKIELGEFEKATIVFGDDEGGLHPEGPLAKDGRTAWRVLLRQSPAAVVNHFLATYAPPVLDPFAGGGSIPLEAQRLGLRAHASDLNPVAVLINKALIEIPPKFAGMPPVNPEWQSKTENEKKMRQWIGAEGLAEDVRYYGNWIREEAERRIGHLYPKITITDEMAKDRSDLSNYVGEDLTVIAWIWARTVASPNPALAGKTVPLIHSYWLSKRKGKEAHVEPLVDTLSNTYQFRVRPGIPTNAFDPDLGTVMRTGATCLLSGVSIPLGHIREEGINGRLGQQLVATVCEGKRTRIFLDPTLSQENLAKQATPSAFPISRLPEQALGFRVQLYGMDEHWKLFTNRQLFALTVLSDLVRDVGKHIVDATSQLEAISDALAYQQAVTLYLAFAFDRVVERHTTIAIWDPSPTKLQLANTFRRQAIPITWDFAEGNPLCNSSGTWSPSIEWVAKAIENLPASPCGKASQSNAATETSHPNCMVSTDPPYYDNIGYADLSDFFYVWLRRNLHEAYPELMRTLLTPKTEELIATPFRHDGDMGKAARFFEHGLGDAIGHWRNHADASHPLTIFYAFKQSETDSSGTASTGWETFLGGVIEHGFAVTATWPMRTELTSSLKKNVAALASSIVLACVPRLEDAPLATRREFADRLRAELPSAIRNMQSGSIAPVDLAQASIGPGMAVFSRYSKVVNADGSKMTVREALQQINQILDEVLAEQEGDYDDWTRWALKWFEQYGVKDGPYGDAETLAKAMAVSVQGVVDAGIVKSGGGKVRLLKRDELDPAWDPLSDDRLTIWEVTHYLIRALNKEGEQAAANLLHRVGAGHGETARELAYRLYQVCERKKWAAEALGYNGLVVSWPEIVRLSRDEGSRPPEQSELFS